jgi:hypothetical protein
MRLRQRDGVTCGPTVAIVAGALLDPDYRAQLTAAGWFDSEQGRVHRHVNRIWPRALGTTPAGMAQAMTIHGRRRGARYGWRVCSILYGRRDRLADVRQAVAGGWPVAMLVGSLIPRHWVLLVEVSGDTFGCYEPSSGETVTVGAAAIRAGRLTGVGYPRPFAFVLPVSDCRLA